MPKAHHAATTSVVICLFTFIIDLSLTIFLGSYLHYVRIDDGDTPIWYHLAACFTGGYFVLSAFLVIYSGMAMFICCSNDKEFHKFLMGEDESGKNLYRYYMISIIGDLIFKAFIELAMVRLYQLGYPKDYQASAKDEHFTVVQILISVKMAFDLGYLIFHAYRHLGCCKRRRNISSSSSGTKMRTIRYGQEE